MNLTSFLSSSLPASTSPCKRIILFVKPGQYYPTTYDPCYSNPCRNGATCSEDYYYSRNYHCSCPRGYSGQNCDYYVGKWIGRSVLSNYVKFNCMNWKFICTRAVQTYNSVAQQVNNMFIIGVWYQRKADYVGKQIQTTSYFYLKNSDFDRGSYDATTLVYRNSMSLWIFYLRWCVAVLYI